MKTLHSHTAILFVFLFSIVWTFLHLYLLCHNFDAVWGLLVEELGKKDSSGSTRSLACGIGLLANC